MVDNRGVGRAIDQLLFGYRDGHELLAGSIDVDARLEAELLPHADARFEDESDRYLVGLRIASLDRFMLTMIWPAPELPRPGAVWAHALLLNDQILKEADPLLLRNYFQRPQDDDFGHYQRKLAFNGHAKRRAHVDVPKQLMLALCEAVYDPTEAQAVVIWPDELGAETGLLALWRFLPEPVRHSFSFRTRGRARTGSSRYGVQVATQLAGRSASQEARLIWPEKVNPDASVVLLASAACDPQERLGDVLDSYALNVMDARSIAGAWPLITDEDAASLLRHFESKADRTPFQFAEALFAPVQASERLWGVSEVERVLALLGAQSVIYLRMLDSFRLQSAWRSSHAAMLELLDRRWELKTDAAGLLLDSGVTELNPDEIVDRLKDRELIDRALRERDDLLRADRFWRALDRSSDRELRERALSVAGPETAPILVKAKCWSLLDQALDRSSAFPLIAELLAGAPTGNVQFWQKAMHGRERQLASLLSSPSVVRPGVSILAAAILSRDLLSAVPLRRWLDAASCLHRQEDQASAIAASRLAALAYCQKNPVAREVLIECFGPAHKALEKDKLPLDVVAELDDSLPNPKMKSLAKRLNRALILSMESSQWTEAELRRALEDAGPEARRLVKLVPKKNPLRRRIEGALHDLEGLLPLG